MDEIPDNETPQVNYVIFCHGETLFQPYTIPQYLGRVINVAYPVCNFTVLMGYQENIDLICNADDVPAEERRTGDTIHDMQLTGGLDPRYSYGIYKCIKYNGIPSRSEQILGMNGAYRGLLSEAIEYIFTYHAYTHPTFDFRRITVHACRDIGDPFAPREEMKTHTEDDLVKALSGLTMGGNTRRRRCRSRGRRGRGRRGRGRSKKTKK
jgi:hypothetical protein